MTSPIQQSARAFEMQRMTRRQALVGSAAGALIAVVPQITAFGQTPEASPAASDLSVRPNAKNLTDDQKTAFTEAILAMKIKPSPWINGLSVYDTFVNWHRDAFVCGISAAHMGPAFFPWHRMYLHLFQQQLWEIDSSVTLPYWDWTVDTEKDSYVWQDDFMGGNGDRDEGEAVTTGPFRKGEFEITVFDYGDTDQFPYIIRDFAAGDLGPSLPTPEDLENALAIGTYDAEPWNSTTAADGSFRNFFEGWRDCASQSCDPVLGEGCTCTGGHELHNRVHLWVSGEFMFAHEHFGNHDGHATPVPADEDETIFGTMAANSSPNDPVFFLHHANVDRCWNLWLNRHGPHYVPEHGGPYGHNLNDAMWPYFTIGLEATPAMMLDSRSLGYVYDTDL